MDANASNLHAGHAPAFSSSGVRLFGRRLLGATEAEVLPNVRGETIFDFRVSRYRLFLAGPRIEVDVVARPRAPQDTAVANELSDELPPLHTAMAFSRYSSGTSSRNIIR